MAFGYIVVDDGSQWVHFRSVTSHPYGDNTWAWDASDWEPGAVFASPRGVRLSPIAEGDQHRANKPDRKLTWHGPAGKLYSSATGTATNLHYYVVERSPDINPTNFVPVTTPSTEHQATVPEGPGEAVFYRVRLLE